MIGGPLFGCIIKIVSKIHGDFESILFSEYNKHNSSSGKGDNTRVGAYTIHEPSGLAYEGEWTYNDKTGIAVMSGNGKCNLGFGASYAGMFEHNEMNGPGKMQLCNGDVLLGSFEKGLLHGDGKIEYANGDSFTGKFQNGVRTGHGDFKSLTWHYVGDWVYDQPQGKGKLTCGKDVYEGNFEDGNFHSGEYKASDGVTYSGKFLNYLLEGPGIVKFQDGHVFAGNFRCGQKDGEGKLECPDGSVLKGTWSRDLPHGNAMSWKGGNKHWMKTYEGAYVDGRPHGKGEATFSDGSSFSGLWRAGIMEKGEWTHSNKAVVSGKALKGERLLKGSYTTDGMTLEGNVDPMKNTIAGPKGRVMPVQFAAPRPSFPTNLVMNIK